MIDTKIAIEKVSKSFRAHQALTDVSLSIPAASTYGLLGPNGAGKTTLIRIINQISTPDSGNIWFDGEKLQKKHIAQIGYLPEERGLYRKMKVGEQAMYLARLKGMGKKDAQKALRQWFEKFDLMKWWHKKVETLSKGMQQKVQFIATVVHQPKLLIFDEPFSGFDPINTDLIREEILRLQQEGTTIIFSTHRMESVEEICDHIALINNSKMVLEGSLADIRNQNRSNVYYIRLLTKNSQQAINLGEAAQVIKQQKISENEIELEIARNEKTTINALANQIMQYGTLLTFSEKIPSVKEIFIQTVNKIEP